jgi:hypothetical protein
VQPFARNTLCALAQEDLEVSRNNLLDVMLREDVRVGTSTPVADPSGDYAFELFDKAEAVRPGAAEALKAKALQLTGGPDSPQPDAREDGAAAFCRQQVKDAFESAARNGACRPFDLFQMFLLNLGAKAQRLGGNDNSFHRHLPRGDGGSQTRLCGRPL